MARTYTPVRAPAFPEGLAWLNTPHPLRLADLRGKFVLLDFWTFCCINCMHVLPDLKRLEQAYRDELIVIGVHSAKFENEQDTESIRNAILRYQIEHPVVNDHGFAIWQQYAVRAWPTLILIDPNGYIVGTRSGEGVFEPFDQALHQLIPVFEAEGALDRSPLEISFEQEQVQERMLAYPGKITGDAGSGRLFIADTNHHRLLVTNLKGQVLDTIGSGETGLHDGSFEEATFRQPQGIWFDGATETLFIADTENHALRRANLRTRSVTTLAGNGIQAPYGTIQANGSDSPLNSPWDVLLHNNDLYVAMAGLHQLWRFDHITGQGTVYAGNGHENIVDGLRLDAQLAQPSGLATDGTFLYFADSETSALRRVPFGNESVTVETLIGEGLFEFGDVDGLFPSARLQHPLGVAFADGVVYLADSYNHKIKRYFLKDRALVSFLGTGLQGHTDGPHQTAQFNEPGGLTVVDEQVYIADTNNHQIRVANLATGTVKTLPIAALPAIPLDKVRRLPQQSIAPGTGTILLDLSLPDGYHPNPVNPGTLALTSDDPTVAQPKTETHPVAYPMTFVCAFAPGTAPVFVEGALYYCDDRNGHCLLERLYLEIPLTVHTDASSEIRLALAIPLADGTH